MRKRYTLLILLLCLLIPCLQGCGRKEGQQTLTSNSATVVAQTQYGTICGVHDEKTGTVAFKGIPFAAPPIGDLRFEPPQKPKPWKNTLDCTEFAPTALQIPNRKSLTYGEDCLSLNLWAPEDCLQEGKHYPVLIFIHGGAYAQGSPSYPKYDGTAFAQDGIIQVNIAYRLNALGFVNDTSMGESGGNLGTLDQIVALQWVHDNIAAFGGDPERVTICGESAGAFSVSAMMFSPKAKGLFQRAILQSGNLLSQPIIMPGASGSDIQSRETTKAFLQSLGYDSLETLKSADGQLLADASGFSMDLTAPLPYSFFPAFNGSILPENPYRALRSGDLNSVDIITGCNTDEGSIFIPDGQTEKDYRAFVSMIFDRDASKVLTRFPVDTRHTATQRMRQIVQYGYVMGSSTFADELSKQGNTVYQYNFDYHLPDMDAQELGVTHASELGFIFKTNAPDMKLYDDADRVESELHARWLGFVKTGDPNSELTAPGNVQSNERAVTGVQWPEYSLKTKKILRINHDSQVIDAPDQEEIAFFRELVWGD